MANLGIKETTEAVDFAVGLVKVISAVKADGKVDISDLAQLFPLIALAGPAMNNINQVPAELKDLDPEEATQLISKIMADLGVSDPKARQVIDASLKFAIAGYGLFHAIVDQPVLGPVA